MLNDRFWIFGRLAKFFAYLHYRYEVAPYCKKVGHGRWIAAETVGGSASQLFKSAWDKIEERSE